jgi:hypothetical protein
MKVIFVRSWLIASSILTLGFAATQVSASELRLVCSSTGSYAECDAGVFVANPRLLQKLSHVQPDGSGDCIFGQSWGYHDQNFWVNYGCSAEFAFSAASPQPAPPPESTPCPPPPPPPPPNQTGLRCDRVPGSGAFYFPSYNGQTIGVVGNGGFSPVNQCNNSVATSVAVGAGLICSWDGYGFMPYSLSTMTVLGNANTGFADPNNCNAVVATSKKGLVCSWSGQGWHPYSISSAHGIPGGFANERSCLDELDNSQNGLVCAANANGLWQPYSFRIEHQMGVANYGWQELSACRESVAMSRSGYVCNWNGVGFQPYLISNNTAYGQYSYPTVQECYSSVR